MPATPVRTPVPLAVACALALLSPACKRPIVGPPSKSAQTGGGPDLRISGAAIDGTGHLVVSIALTDGGAPVATREAALALEPSFTLAALSRHPVDGLAAWKSLLLTGAQTAPALPPAGPGTPPALVVADARQPGAERTGTFAGADGAFTYAFANALPTGFDPSETLRIGIWLDAVDGTPTTTATYDFRPAGGAPAPRDTVQDTSCGTCHGTLRHHDGRRVGVRICLTCHTWQHSDPDTIDPAALGGSTAATDPNPLELGRLVHRIHRGKWLPTLYASSSSAPAPALPSATPPALPFATSRTSGTTALNPPVLGRKFAVVGELSRERVYAQVVERRENGLAPKIAVKGLLFPRGDLRDCGVCHAGAPQEYEVLFGISRRTCQGCHPEVWFAPPNADGTTSITEPAPAVHFAHTGGPMADDTECAGCHVTATAAHPKVYAPIADAHVVPRDHPRASRPTLEIVSVTDLRPGGAPTVKFKLWDRVGAISPPNAPTPANDTAALASPVPRAMYSLRVAVAGATEPDYLGPAAPMSSSDTGNPNPLALVADAQGVFTYTFVSGVPDTATGTWSVALEGRRRAATAFYDVATDTFGWPFTGETVTESPDNVLVYVDTAAGTWPGGGAPVPRRRVVAQEKCLRCHGRFELHGGTRHAIELCVTCHTPRRTDWSGRPKWAVGTPLAGRVNLGATFDGIEERSTQLKMMVHRIHTGRRVGSAALDLVRPYSGSGTSASFREGMFPSDLARCTLCHEGRSYELDVVPADAPPTLANETPTVRHDGTIAHAAEEVATPPVTAACLACHATGGALTHVARYPATAAGESCGACHLKGTFGVAEAHGLAPPRAAVVASSFSSIAAQILVPRCASAACHGGGPPAAFPRLDAEAAYDALLEVPSQQASGIDLVEPFAPERSYLVLKLRGDAASVGGVASPMPIGDAALDPSDLAAIEAWIASGAPRD